MDNSPIRVLVIDDDEDDYVATRDLLSKAQTKYAVNWVLSYEAALTEFEADRHDVYLIDYYLGPRNGLERLQDPRCLGSRAPMILLTGLGDHDVDLEAMKAGAADYLVKDYINADLIALSDTPSNGAGRSESGPPLRSSFGSRKKWRRWGSWPAASRTTSTTC